MMEIITYFFLCKSHLHFSGTLPALCKNAVQKTKGSLWCLAALLLSTESKDWAGNHMTLQAIYLLRSWEQELGTYVLCCWLLNEEVLNYYAQPPRPFAPLERGWALSLSPIVWYVLIVLPARLWGHWLQCTYKQATVFWSVKSGWKCLFYRFAMSIRGWV